MADVTREGVEKTAIAGALLLVTAAIAVGSWVAFWAIGAVVLRAMGVIR